MAMSKQEIQKRLRNTGHVFACSLFCILFCIVVSNFNIPQSDELKNFIGFVFFVSILIAALSALDALALILTDKFQLKIERMPNKNKKDTDD